MRPASTLRRLTLIGVAASLVAAPAATAGPPTPPREIRTILQEPVFLLSLPADGGAWTLWSGTLDGDRWWMLSRPRATEVGGGPCPATSKRLTVCFNGVVGTGRTVAVGRVAPGLAVRAVDESGRPLPKARQGDAYLVVARGMPQKVVITARDRGGDVVARRTVVYREPA